MPADGRWDLTRRLKGWFFSMSETLRKCMYVCMYYVCMYVRMCVCVCMCVCMYLCMYVCMCVCVCMYVFAPLEVFFLVLWYFRSYCLLFLVSAPRTFCLYDHCLLFLCDGGKTAADSCLQSTGICLGYWTDCCLQWETIGVFTAVKIWV